MIVIRRRALPAVVLLAVAAVRAQGITPPAEVAAALPGARLRGSGRLRFFGLHVYDAHLWAGASGVGADWTAAPLALELEYARELKGALIAERSIQEMRRQAEISDEQATRWLAAMKAIFPDVKSGDRITGLLLPAQGAQFFVNGRAAGEVPDARFAGLFFGIWLSPRSSEPALRESLLGRAGP